MKKKIFLITAMVALLLCVFAISVSAANEVTLTDGTTADLATVFKISSNQITGFNDGYTKDSVTDVTFPDEIEGLEANTLFNNAANLNSITFAATDTFFISGDGIFSGCSVKKITFNPNCVVEIRKGNFSSCKSLTEITFPKFKKLAGSSFAYCENMVATNELVLVEGMTEIGGHAFQSCKLLTGNVIFPSTLEKIQEYSFEKAGFNSYDFSKCSKLTVAGGGYGGPFTNNDSITTLDLSGCTSLTYLKNNFAASCDNLTSVILPPNLKTIESKALAHCYKLQSIVFPATMQSVADEAFHSARSGQTVKTFTVYIQSNVKMGESYPFRDSSAKIEYVLIGDGVTAESFIAANTFTGVTGATVVDYLDPASPWTYTPGQTISSHTIVENYCKPLALTGSHAYNENPCVTVCEKCKIATVKENPQHDILITITYENGYDNKGVKLTTCKNDGCSHTETVVLNELIKCLGYSTAEFENGGISVGFYADKTAIANYETLTGDKVSYGLFAGTKAGLGTNDVIGENGKAVAGAITAGFDGSEYSYMFIKMFGFNEDNKDTLFAIGAYVEVANEEGKAYSYLQESKPNDGEKYSFIKYNGFVIQS